MIFEKKNKSDLDILNCFKPIRKNFYFSGKTAIKQLAKLMNNAAVFYKVYDKERFIGCIFVNEINEKDKVITWGGFAYRHVNTKQAIRELMEYLRHHYPDFEIKAYTEQRTAKISLIRAGLHNDNKGGYIYYD